MDKRPQISVIIPVYNVESYLAECLKSITNQTFYDLEIICVNDGSTDQSLDILNSFSNLDARIRVYSQTNKGAASARNLGLSLAQGDYLAILDADDVYELDFLSKMYNRAQTYDCDMVISRCDLFTDNDLSHRLAARWSVKQSLLPSEEVFSSFDILSHLFFSITGWSWDKLIKREIVTNNDLSFQALSVFNDMYFVYSAFIASQRISVVDEVLIHHRQHNTSISKQHIQDIKSLFSALRKVKQFLVQNNIFTRFEQDYVNYALHMPIFLYEKLKENDQDKLKSFLVKSWVQELNFFSYPRNYFYEPKEYDFYLQLLYPAHPNIPYDENNYRALLDSIHRI